MLKILLASTLVCLAPAAVRAKTFKLGDDKPIATIAIPDDWESEAAEGGVESLSPDKAIYLSAEMVASEDLKEAAQDVSKTLADEKIKLKPETKTQAPLTVAGQPGVELAWDAIDADGPTRVHLFIVKVVEGEEALLLRWGAADDEKARAAELDAILKSLAPVKEAPAK